MTNTCLGDNQNGLQSHQHPLSSYERTTSHSPLPRKMLRRNRHKPLNTPQNRPMNNDGALHLLVIRPVLQVEPLRELEVELDRRALVRALQGVADRDIDLGAVERAVARVELPFAGIVLFEGLFELLGGGLV